jgi:serine phosphatase RsbU (regulator of sigma subunit)/ABC-type amino acid transport substrate-binding protein
MNPRQCHRWPFLVLVAGLLGAIAGPQASGAVQLTDEQRVWLQQKRKLVFASDSEYHPYTFLDGDQKRGGLDIDVAEAVGRVLRVPVEFQMVSWTEALKRALSGRADAMAGMNQTPERAEQWDFVQPHAEVSFYLFVREDMQLIHSISDLPGMRVGVGKGSLVEPLLRADPRITVVNYPRGRGMQELLDKEIRAYAGNLLVQSYYIQSHGIRDVKVVGDPLMPPVDYGMAVAKGKPELVAILNAAVRELKSSGELAKIQRKWIGERFRPPLISRKALRALWIGLGTAAGLALLGFLRSWELRLVVNRKTARIAALRSLGHSVAQAHDVAGVLERAMSVLEPLMRREALFVITKEADDQRWILRHSRLPQPLETELRQEAAGNLTSGSLLADVMHTGRPVILERLENTARLVHTPLTQHGFRSLSCFPVAAEGRTLGVLGVLSRRMLFSDPKESDFQQAVAAELGIAVANARLIGTLELRVRERTAQLNERNEQLEADLRMAREVQFALMPFQNVPVVEIARCDGAEPTVLRLYNRYNPARTVGGDFFEVLHQSPTAAGVFVCDVMGQGARAALLTAILHTLLDELADDAGEPSAVLSRLNRRLIDILKTQGSPIFATAFYCCFDLAGRKLTYANAGHPWPFVLDLARGKPESLAVSAQAGPALGLFGDAEFPQATQRLDAASRWLFYTDGLFETCNHEGEAFGMERMLGVIDRELSNPPQRLLDELVNGLTQFCGGAEIDDDICLVAVEASRSK